MSAEKTFRIILWGISSTGWRGDQKAVVYDAKSIGIEEQANDSGSAYWTLDNDHPQIAEFVPLARHYEISRYSDARSRWEFVGAGMLNDYNVTEYQTTFSGLDYKAVLNQVYTPLSSNTAMTTSTAGSLNIDTSNFTQTLSNEAVFKAASSTAYVNTTALSVGVLTMETFNGPNTQGTGSSNGEYINDPDGTTTYWKAPVVKITGSVSWVNPGTVTTGFDNALYLMLFASPPTSKDSGEPPLGNYGRIGTWSTGYFSGPTLPNGTTITFSPIYLTVAELEKAVTDAGYQYTGVPVINDEATIRSNMPNPLRSGVTYSFQLYAAIKRTSTGVWYRSKYGSITGSVDTTTKAEVTMGQVTQNASQIVSEAFSTALTLSTFSRLRYASLSVSGSTATTHTTYTAGEPVLDYITAVCDLEMGAKTDGSKVVFGIDKPTGGASYSGNFKLNLSVSSSASTAMALRYPDNIRSFSFTPGFSRVRNDITIVPTTLYLSGGSGQAEGASIIGASASDSASIASNGRIPLIVPKGGLVDAKAAQNEANRLLATYKPANTKQVNIRAVLDGVDLWNGWDVGDSVKLTVNRGLAVVDEPFVITGVRWFGESDGHERIELDLMQGTAFSAVYAAPIPTTEAS